MLFATIFLVAFAILAGVVMYLSKTIEHGEARFDTTLSRDREDDESDDYDDEDDEQ